MNFINYYIQGQLKILLCILKVIIEISLNFHERIIFLVMITRPWVSLCQLTWIKFSLFRKLDKNEVIKVFKDTLNQPQFDPRGITNPQPIDPIHAISLSFLRNLSFMQATSLKGKNQLQKQKKKKGNQRLLKRQYLTATTLNYIGERTFLPIMNAEFPILDASTFSQFFTSSNFHHYRNFPRMDFLQSHCKTQKTLMAIHSSIYFCNDLMPLPTRFSLFNQGREREREKTVT